MRYATVDGLRAYAALIVVLSHFSDFTGMWGDRLGNGGGLVGVMLFFLISGFLMARLYCLEEEPNIHSLLSFAQHRIARVVPLYLLIVLGSFAAVSMFGSFAALNYFVYPITPANLSEHLLFLNGVSVLWTVPIEIHFYLLFAVIWFATRYVRGLMLFPTALAATVIFCTFIPKAAHSFANAFCYFLLFFLTGTVIAFAHRAGLIRNSKWWDAVFCALMVAVVLVMRRLGLQLFGWYLSVDSPLTLLIMALLLISALGSSVAGKLLGGRIARFGGDISYSVYLLHCPILASLCVIRPANTAMFLFISLMVMRQSLWLRERSS